MGIMTRMARMWKADIHGLMDQLEDRELLLKQHLREMEQALSAKEAALNRMKDNRSRLEKELLRCRQENDRLEADLDSAVRNGKDDLARLLIKKRKTVENRRERCGQMIEDLDLEIARTEECLDRQQSRYRDLRLKILDRLKKAEEKERENIFRCEEFAAPEGEPGAEEIELELLLRKEGLKKGGQP